MKAEHRKELQTNLLADRMGRLVQGMRSGSQATSTVVWIIGLLTVGLAVVWMMSSGYPSSRADLWLGVDKNYDKPGDLEKLAHDNPNTLPARYAQFQVARLSLQEGLTGLYPDRNLPGKQQTTSRSDAIGEVEKARNLYVILANEVKPFAARGTDHALQLQEALLGAAKAEEALTDVPQDKEGEAKRGSLERALTFYREYLERAKPDGFKDKSVADTVQELDQKGSSLTAAESRWLVIARHVQELEANGGASAKQFYDELNTIARTETKKLP